VVALATLKGSPYIRHQSRSPPGLPGER